MNLMIHEEPEKDRKNAEKRCRKRDAHPEEVGIVRVGGGDDGSISEDNV